MGLLFAGSEEDQRGRRKNQNLHAVGDTAHTADSPEVTSLDVGGGDAGGCGGGCGGCGGYGGCG